MLLCLLAGCGKQLNPAYCKANPQDTDCRNAGLVGIDAPAPCSDNTACAMNDPDHRECDLQAGLCVECYMDDTTCVSRGLLRCGSDDLCHGCLTDNDCGTGKCLPNGSCLSGSNILYVSSSGSGTACTEAAKCLLAQAIALVNSSNGAMLAVEIDDGTYNDGPYTISGLSNAVLFATSGNPDGVIIQNGFTVTTQGKVEFDHVSITNAANDGITCMASTVVPHHVKIFNNTGAGVHATTCTVTIDRSEIYGNAIGLDLDSSAIAVRNNWIFSNGSGGARGDTGVRLAGTTNGKLKFNTVAFNAAKNGAGNFGGIDCGQSGTVDASSCIATGNSGGQNTGNCSFTPIYNAGSAGVFVSNTDLHLRLNAPTPQIINNSASDCSDTPDDIDGDLRPQAMYCDLGADEFK